MCKLEIASTLAFGRVLRLETRLKAEGLLTDEESSALRAVISYYGKTAVPFLDDDKDPYPFEKIWDIYGKKRGRAKCERKWRLLPVKERKLIYERVPAYVEATPDIQFRKDFYTYLNGRCWEDEVRDNKGRIVFDPDNIQYDDNNRPNGYRRPDGKVWDAYGKMWRE